MCRAERGGTGESERREGRLEQGRVQRREGRLEQGRVQGREGRLEEGRVQGRNRSPTVLARQSLTIPVFILTRQSRHMTV